MDFYAGTKNTQSKDKQNKKKQAVHPPGNVNSSFVIWFEGPARFIRCHARVRASGSTMPTGVNRAVRLSLPRLRNELRPRCTSRRQRSREPHTFTVQCTSDVLGQSSLVAFGRLDPARLWNCSPQEIPVHFLFVSCAVGTKCRNHSLSLFLVNLISLTIQLSQ